MTDLTGKSALVTGASRGIGAATAKILAEAGASVVLAARTLDQIEALASQIAAEGGAARAVQWQQMALASEAVLAALDHYIAQGGGSRGARAICDPAGDSLPRSRHGPLPEVRFRPEREEDKREQLVVRLEGHEHRIVVVGRPDDRLCEPGRRGRRALRVLPEAGGGSDRCVLPPQPRL